MTLGLHFLSCISLRIFCIALIRVSLSSFISSAIFASSTSDQPFVSSDILPLQRVSPKRGFEPLPSAFLPMCSMDGQHDCPKPIHHSGDEKLGQGGWIQSGRGKSTITGKPLGGHSGLIIILVPDYSSVQPTYCCPKIVSCNTRTELRCS